VYNHARLQITVIYVTKDVRHVLGALKKAVYPVKKDTPILKETTHA